MRKYLLALCLMLIGTAAYSVPAKPGLWRTITLADGKTVQVQLCGDEHLRYWQAKDGACYVENADGAWMPADMAKLRSAAVAKRGIMVSVQKKMAQRSSAVKKNVAGVGKKYLGDKKGLIILAQFPDKSFGSSHDNAFFNKLANQENYLNPPFVGSVHDYFYSQSQGQFNLTFDVVGPVTLSKQCSYYGRNVTYADGSSDDAHAGAMVAEACQAVADMVDYHDYDWDGDGCADQVFVLYAGKGEADGGGANTVWPHMFYLSASDYGKSLTIDGVVVDTYACSAELNGSGTSSGIGTICHEFSHCLGFADLYDTTYSGGYGMDQWDLMSSGSYNGSSFCPAGYTGYEKWVAGWIEPVELKNDTVVSSQTAQSEGGDTYIMYNDNNHNEFYFIDNRQLSGWDSYIPNHGLLVTHIDYSDKAWDENTVNDDPDHQRYTPIHAGQRFYDIYNGAYYDAAYDSYPYNSLDSLTNMSYPAATLFNANTDGKKLMNKALLNITENSDGTTSFRFRGNAAGNHETKPGEVLLNETFDNCNGTGGNDGKWSGSIATSTFTPDVDGWESSVCKGANKCAKFGSRSVAAEVLSPAFYANSNVRLTFMAAPWTGDGNIVEVSYGDTSLGSFTMEEGKWNTFSVDFQGVGNGRLKFVTDGRLFLDEVKVVVPDGESGIAKVAGFDSKKADGRIYTIDGRCLGTDKNALKSGIYIVNGHKFVK